MCFVVSIPRITYLSRVVAQKGWPFFQRLLKFILGRDVNYHGQACPAKKKRMAVPPKKNLCLLDLHQALVVSCLAFTYTDDEMLRTKATGDDEFLILEDELVTVRCRPYWQSFLEQLYQKFDQVAVFSRSRNCDFTTKITEYLFRGRRVSVCANRGQTDFRFLEPHYASITIVTAHPTTIVSNKTIVTVPPWYGSSKDQVLQTFEVPKPFV